MSTAARHEYASTLPEGTGFCFTDTDPAVWILRARPQLGRYGIATTTRAAGEGHEGEVVIYTVIDWREGVRGKINIMGAEAIRTTSGEDPAIEKMTGHLNTNRRVQIVTGSRKPILLSEIIFPLEDLREHFPSTNQDLVHVGGMARLTGADRCDRCPAQAYVAARLRDCGRTLLFCGHHYNENWIHLLTRVDDVLDQREELTA